MNLSVTVFANRYNMKSMFRLVAEVMVIIIRLIAAATRTNIITGFWKLTGLNSIIHGTMSDFSIWVIFSVTFHSTQVTSFTFFALREALLNLLAFIAFLVSRCSCFSAVFTPGLKFIFF